MIKLKKLEKKLKFFSDNMPRGLKISTITISCNIGTEINIKNIKKYMILDVNEAVTIKYNIKKPDKRVIRKVRSLLPIKKKKTKKKNKKQDVVNQVSLEILHGKTKGPASVKFFTNGAIHITGCRDLKDYLNLMSIAIKILKKKVYKIKTVYDTRSDKLTFKTVMKEKKFYDHSKKIKLKEIKINMINSGFQIKQNIDRERLYNILRDQQIECQYNQNSHAAVRIKIPCKYKGKQKKLAIFVFESGKIIITGGNTTKHLHAGYKFIINKLQAHKSEITLNKLLDKVANLIRKNKIDNKKSS